MSAEFDLHGKKIWVAGHRGMVGSAIVRRLGSEGCDVLTATRDTLDLQRQQDVEAWLAANRPDAVLIAAAKVGGILANDTHPASFLYENLMIETNIIHASHQTGVQKLLFLGSSCIYPKHAPQPIPENALLQGALEPTNQWYAVAKIAGIKLCQAYRRQYGCDFISAMPTNLYGPGDNFDLESSHVIPALLRKAHMAKTQGRDSLGVWGSGTPRREFLYVEDLADACVHLIKVYSDEEHVNIGTGTDLTIRELAQTVAKTVGFVGAVRFDPSKPDGTPRKLLDVGKLNGLGWKATTSLDDGLSKTYAWYRAHADSDIAERVDSV